MPQREVVRVCCVRVMCLRQTCGKLMQKYLAGVRVGEAVIDLELLGNISEIDEVIAHVRASGQMHLQLDEVVAVSQQAYIEYLPGRQQAQAFQVLESAGEFLYYGFLKSQAGMDRRQPGKLQTMLAEIGLAQPGKFLPGNEQQMFGGVSLDQRRADLRHGVNSRERDLLRQQDVQPGLDERRVGQRREQHVIIAPSGFLPLQQGGLVKRRTAIELVEFAFQQRAAAAPEQMRNGFLAEIFLNQIDQQIGWVFHRFQEFAKIFLFGGRVGKPALSDNLAAFHDLRMEVVGAQE